MYDNMENIKYEYKMKGHNCIEPCPIYPDIKIGSENCSRCENFIYGHATFLKRKGFIVCKILNENESNSQNTYISRQTNNHSRG